MPEQSIALTIDVASGAAVGDIGDLLYGNHVAATFFVAGSVATNLGPALARLKSQGHLIGNAGFSLAGFDQLDDPVDDVRRADLLLSPYVTGQMFLLRSPAGQSSLAAGVATRLNQAGLTRYVGQVGWDIGDGLGGFVADDQCWQSGTTPDTCAAQYGQQIASSGRGIVQMHADDAQSTAMLRQLLIYAKADGFSWQRLDQVPQLREALVESGGKPDAVAGGDGCREY